MQGVIPLRQISNWNRSASVITPSDMPILLLIPEIERRYGEAI